MSDSHRRCVLLCPEYFDGRLNGIGRVSEMAGHTITQLGFHLEPWSANEAHGGPGGRCFGGNYFRMILQAMLDPIKDLGAVVCMHAGLSPVARILAARARCPSAVVFHGVDVWGRLRARTRWGVRGMNRILSVSDFTLRECFKNNPELTEVPAEVLPLGLMGGGIPPPKFEPSRHSRGRVLLVTRLTKHCAKKNVRELILAMPHVGAQVSDATLTIVGDGDDRADLEAFATSHVRAGVVRFCGSVPDKELAVLYESADVFAMPSRQEGFGLVFVEAMARGLACVCGNRDAAREVVEDGVTGYAVDPDSPEEIGRAITKLLVDDSLRQCMGKAGWQRYRDHFTREAVACRMRDKLKRCLIQQANGT